MIKDRSLNIFKYSYGLLLLTVDKSVLLILGILHYSTFLLITVDNGALL